jgi:hypothetical protein
LNFACLGWNTNIQCYIGVISKFSIIFLLCIFFQVEENMYIYFYLVIALFYFLVNFLTLTLWI